MNVVDLPSDLSVHEAVERYEASPNVEYVEPDYELHPAKLPDDPKYPKMYELNNRGQTGGAVDADLDAPDAWNVTTGSADTVVAVIDTGMDITHPDLNDNVWTNPDEVPDNGIDDDSNGYIDDVHGWDFHDDYVVSRDRGAETYRGGASVFDGAKQDLHGTIAAGPIAAEGNNGTGVTGINWLVKVVPLKIVGPDGVVHVTDAIDAINYAVNENIDISSNSWGGGDYSQALFDAIDRAGQQGHLFVAAAGNGNEDWLGDNNDTRPFYPASYDTPSNNVISVAASNDTDTLTSFSNYGAESVDLAAPGRDIPCPVPGDSYSLCWGTSIATPHVSARTTASTAPRASAAPNTCHLCKATLF